MADKQRTLANPFTIKGQGLHTGVHVTMKFNPAPVNHGFRFKRTDLPGQPVIDADCDLVTDTSRGTLLEQNEVQIGTIEHSLAALVGMGLDNVLIEIDNKEAPIMDGSAKYFVEAIEKSGVVEQEADREYFVIRKTITYTDKKTGAELVALPDNDYCINTMISFNSTVLNNQFATLNTLDQFKDEIANCRTFVFLHELEFLLQNNLIKGGALDNAIVIVDKNMSQEELDRLADVFHHKRVKVKSQGILNNIDLYFDNECARHKLLDVVGDLALVGKPIKGRIIATKPGHDANTKMAKLLKKALKNEKSTVPDYDPNQTPVLDINQIKEFLPHRYPFLLVDKIIQYMPDGVVGIKNVTGNEFFFQGHFPDEPVMPGVLLVEAMAQTGGLYVLRHLEDKYATYFIRMDNVRFRRKVVPGDTLILKMTLMSPIRRGLAHMKGSSYVGDKIVAEGEFIAQLIKKKPIHKQ